MAYNNEEQESIDALKAFWNRYGTAILAVVTVVLLAIAGWRGWHWYQANQAAKAGAVYDQLVGAVQAKDTAKVKEFSGVIFEQFSGTAYGQMTALVGARYYLESDDTKAAKPLLQWAMDKAKDDEFKVVARVRLAGVLLQEQALDEAAKLVAIEPANKFLGMVLDRRGDVLVAQNKPDLAREAYAKALEKLDANSPLRSLVQLKLDALPVAGS
jgi:predicted negative regulator of RcsB-dependent stress response